jgi:hypothetical protein
MADIVIHSLPAIAAQKTRKTRNLQHAASGVE